MCPLSLSLLLSSSIYLQIGFGEDEGVKRGVVLVIGLPTGDESSPETLPLLRLLLMLMLMLLLLLLLLLLFDRPLQGLGGDGDDDDELLPRLMVDR